MRNEIMVGTDKVRVDGNRLVWQVWGAVGDKGVKYECVIKGKAPGRYLLTWCSKNLLKDLIILVDFEIDNQGNIKLRDVYDPNDIYYEKGFNGKIGIKGNSEVFLNYEC